MKRKEYGFTILEILTVMVVITILIGVLIPALMMVHTIAKETQQRAQFMEINLAMEAFKGDYGDYPPSGWGNDPDDPYSKIDYCGGQKLAEALVGLDLLGFNPDSEWQADGETLLLGNDLYFIDVAFDPTNDSDVAELKKRRGPYLESLERVFRLDGRYAYYEPLEPETYVICDVYAVKKVMLADGSIVKAGTPILYYRANTSKKTMEDPNPRKRIYCALDNVALIRLKWEEDKINNPSKDMPPLMNSSGSYAFFRDYIRDPKITAANWPYRPDSYILISAGKDGEYGTDDDICNFGD